MINLWQSLRRMIRFGRVTKSGTNGQKFWIQQIEYLGKTSDCLFMFPYGTHANLPPNDVLSIFFSMEGHPENRVGIGWTPALRPDLEPGEVAYYHPFSNSIAIFRNNGDIDIDTVKDGDSNNININTNDLNVTVENNVTVNVIGNATVMVDGDADVGVDGNVTLDVGMDVDATIGGDLTVDVTGNTDVTTPLLTLNGDMQVNGTIDATGVIHSDSDVTGPSISLESHMHTGSPTAGTGPVSNTGGPI